MNFGLTHKLGYSSGHDHIQISEKILRVISSDTSEQNPVIPERSIPMNSTFDYYRTHGAYTGHGNEELISGETSADIGELVRIVQANMIHAHWLPRYGLAIPEVRRNREMNLRTLHDRFQNIRDLAGTFATSHPHPKEIRSIGTCRDFTLLLTTLLRDKGIPAREWCGFATYFLPDHFEDHWICEWWNKEQQRWILTDSQLDAFQSDILKTDFDPLDIPRERFLNGAQAWTLCREGKYNPDHFGIFEFHGMDFIKGNFIRHIASLNKVPLLPWDCWGLINKEYAKMSEDDLSFLDNLAQLTADTDVNFDKIHSIYSSDLRVKMDGTVTSYCSSFPVTVSGLAS